jgi:alkylation response protein AidB-like acyl-CoA dehydrogenase
MTAPSASPGNASSAIRASLSGTESGEPLRWVAAPDARTLAEELARDFARTAVERDRQGGTAKRERDRLRQSGLLGLSVPVELGGAGASWSEVLEVVRILARVDGSLAHLFGFHHLMLATARLFGAPQQWRPLLRETVRQRWFWGNALNPLDARTTLSRDGEGFLIDGAKSFCSGSVDSDMLIVSALRPPETRLAIAAIPTRRSGIVVRGDWDNMGQRQTDSGGIDFTRVRIEPGELLDTPGPLGSIFASLRPCIAQLILANVYLGLGEGALAEAREYTRSARRAWIHSSAPSANEDPYVLHRYGELWLELESARLLSDRAASLLSAAWLAEDSLTARARGETAIAIAAAKAGTTRAGLSVANDMFEVMGARATSAGARFDRFWRNLRTHTLHDPVDYKFRELGDFALNERLPTPSFYS